VGGANAPEPCKGDIDPEVRSIFLVVTGGGTGGHVYPALEVARAASQRGSEILYLGSERGQEKLICARFAIPCQVFGSRPLYSLKSPQGWRSLVALLKATQLVKGELKRRRPDAVFSTGGYSAAPVMQAAKSLDIPLCIHESNSVPGRANRMFAPKAAGFTCTFRTTTERIKGAVRTGQPIRAELREAAAAEPNNREKPLVLTVGGSQGSQFLNENVPEAAKVLHDKADFLLAAGRGNYDKVKVQVNGTPGLLLVPYLEIDALLDAYSQATVAVARSGGTVAEFALFGLPSVLVPLPTSADDHQLRNAQEFVGFGGAILLEQKDADPSSLADAIDEWLASPEKREAARKALKEWDVPDATERILAVVERAATRHN